MNSADKLLELLSCRGQVPIGGASGFLNAVEEVFREDVERDQKFWIRLATDLTEAGFARRSDDGRRLEAERPALTALPSEGHHAILLGARTQRFVERIESISSEVGLEFESSKATETERFPTRVMLRGNNEGLKALATRMSLRLFLTPLPFILARDHQNIPDGLRASEFQHSLAIRDARWFNPRTLRFNGQAPAVHGTAGLCKYEQHGIRHSLYRVRNSAGEFEAMTVADVATAKWALISVQGGRLPHDAHSKAVAVPTFCPLPRDLGRSLALCSGLRPLDMRLSSEQSASLGFAVEDLHVRVYRDVHPVISRLVSERTGCRLQEISLSE